MAWDDASNPVIKQTSKDTIDAINHLDSSVKKLDDSTTRANRIMIWLNIIMVVLTIAILGLSFVMVIK